MIITLSPICAPILPYNSDPLQIEKVGRDLLINGELFEFSKLQNGDVLPNSAFDLGYIVGDVTCNEQGVVLITLTFPHGYDAPHEAKFPEPILVTEDGPVTLPDACWPPKEPEYPEEPEQPEPEDGN